MWSKVSQNSAFLALTLILLSSFTEYKHFSQIQHYFCQQHQALEHDASATDSNPLKDHDTCDGQLFPGYNHATIDLPTSVYAPYGLAVLAKDSQDFAPSNPTLLNRSPKTSPPQTLRRTS